jgi:outer membrane receptor protein involved in Fe transport
MDIRAPNLSNLFGYSYGHNTTVDPFQGNISAPSYTITAGNPDLKPEKAHQTEIGIVLQPSFMPGFHFSADWWRIKITGAIATVGAAFELQECYNSRVGNAYTGSSPYCSLITRNADNSLNSVEVIPFNVATFLAQGIDYQADYRTRLNDIVGTWPGAIAVSLSATQTQKLITNTGIPGPAQTLDAAGYAASSTAGSGAPKWSAFGSLAYEIDAWRFTWAERFVSAVSAANTYIQCASNCPSVIPAGFSTINWNPRIGSYALANVSAQFKFMEGDRGKNATAFVAVDNVFNRMPPWAHTVPGQLFALETNPTLYDTVGTYARAGIRFQF